MTTRTTLSALFALALFTHTLEPITMQNVITVNGKRLSHYDNTFESITVTADEPVVAIIDDPVEATATLDMDGSELLRQLNARYESVVEAARQLNRPPAPDPNRTYDVAELPLLRRWGVHRPVLRSSGAGWAGCARVRALGIFDKATNAFRGYAAVSIRKHNSDYEVGLADSPQPLPRRVLTAHSQRAAMEYIALRVACEQSHPGCELRMVG